MKYLILLGIALGLFLGLALGVAIAGLHGGIIGAAIGASLGFVIIWSVEKIQQADRLIEAQFEQHQLICMPRATVATCELVRDLENGQWIDVKRCDLTDVGQQGCEKACLKLMNDSGI
jgi:hypothetical protein